MGKHRLIIKQQPSKHDRIGLTQVNIKFLAVEEAVMQQITNETFFLQGKLKINKLQAKRKRQATKQVRLAKVKKGKK